MVDLMDEKILTIFGSLETLKTKQTQLKIAGKAAADYLNEIKVSLAREQDDPEFISPYTEDDVKANEINLKRMRAEFEQLKTEVNCIESINDRLPY